MCLSVHLPNVIKYLLFFFKPMLGAVQKESHLNFSLTLADEEIRYEREREKLDECNTASKWKSRIFLIKNCILIQLYANKILIKISIQLAYY